MKQIPLFKVFTAPKAMSMLADTFASGFIGQGPRVEEFENLLRGFIGHEYLATTNSATSALTLAIHLLKSPYYVPSDFGATERWPGLNLGDEIISTPLSCLATNTPIVANGLKIKWADVSPANLNIDLDDVERKITEKTKAIMVVHWGGYPVDLDKLAAIQGRALKKYGFRPAVIEDCAHAFGAAFNGKRIGGHGNICAFSFQAIKHIQTAADGGLLSLPHEDLYRRAKLLRWYGINRDDERTAMRCESDVAEAGFKYHMNDVCATVGLANMKYVYDILFSHRAISSAYDLELKSVPGITLLERDPRMESASWIYSMLVDRKQDFMKHMAAHGIAVSQVHERNDKHSCFNEFKTSLPQLVEVCSSLISIPIHYGLSDADVKYIIETIKKGW